MWEVAETKEGSKTSSRCPRSIECAIVSADPVDCLCARSRHAVDSSTVDSSTVNSSADEKRSLCNISQEVQSNVQRRTYSSHVSSRAGRARGRSPTSRRSRRASPPPRRHNSQYRFAQDWSRARLDRLHDINNYAPTYPPHQHHRHRRDPSSEPQD